VGAIAAQPARWRDIVRLDTSRRWYHRLELTDDHEVWLLSWLPGQSTGFHDHGAAVSVHAYSPPLAAMRRYELTAAGLVHMATEHSGLNW
jgi:hypothetical protein